MPYTTVATARTPALIIYLIDVSGSMSEKLDGMAKIDHVNEAIGNILGRMVQRSTKGEIVSPRYRLAMFAYSDKPFNILGGIETISDVVKRGRPRLSASNATNTHDAFVMAHDLLKREMPNLRGSPAPMVCHLTDGAYSTADPEPVAREIMSMSNDDGEVLLENIYVGSALAKPITQVEAWRGLSTENELTDAYAKTLFRISSPVPKTYADVIQQEGYELQAGSRMLIPCNTKELIELAFTMSGATPTK